MPERGEGYIPSEAREFKVPKPTETKGPETEEGQQAMRGTPEATGAPTHRLGAGETLITTEKAELNHGQETTKDIGARTGPNPSWSSDPSDTTSSKPQEGQDEVQDE